VQANSNDNELFSTDFSSGKGEWLDIKGNSRTELINNQLVISNITQGNDIESVTLLMDSPSLSTGEVELNFLYEGQRNFGLIFRGEANNASTWQSFAYNGQGRWQLGQPGGKWITDISSSPLVYGQNYRLLVRYEEAAIDVYLNGEQLFQSDKVIYPGDLGVIDGDWQGRVGVRLFGNRSTLKINSLKNGPLYSIPLEVKEPEKADPEEVEKLRNKWKQSLVGNFEENSNLLEDQEVKHYIESLSIESEQLYKSLNTNQDRDYLWERQPTDTNSADLTTQFRNLEILSRAYGTVGTSYYQDPQLLNDIVEAFDFLVLTGRFDGERYYGNWWDWQVGIPEKFINALMILGPEIPQEKLTNYTQIIANYVPNPYQQMYTKSQTGSFTLDFIPNFQTTGANRMDLALTVLGLGIFQENVQKLQSASTSAIEVLDIVQQGDGFYKDGSFIQHGNFPYTGTYGNVLLNGVGKILSMVSNSPWEVDEATLSMSMLVQKSFIPLITKGEMMPMVNGRGISRAPADSKEGFGSSTMYNLLTASEFMPEADQRALKESVKYWVNQNPTYYYTNTRNFNDLIITKNLMNDDTIIGDQKPFLGAHVYGAMDRFVYSAPDFGIGISMYSNRIASFQAGNQENRRGWHTADGMLYIFNEDQQFGEGYWPTIDPYRLPGTTVDTLGLEDEVSSFTSVRSSENHVGGATDGQNSVVGMALNKNGTRNNGVILPMNLEAQKSWFVLDGKVIALGSNINGTTSNSIETVIENRMLDCTSKYELIDNQNREVSNETRIMETGDWLLLDSNNQNQGMGYFFPNTQVIETLQETRTGSYSDINGTFVNDRLYQKDYQKVLINHGQNVENGSYEYVMVPNATKLGMEDFAKNNPFDILQNTEDIHLVKDTKQNLMAGNIWSSNGAMVGEIKVDKAAMILIKEEGNVLTVSISNPRQTADMITLTLPEQYQTVISKDDSVKLLDDRQRIEIDTSNSAGATHTFVLELRND